MKAARLTVRWNPNIKIDVPRWILEIPFTAIFFCFCQLQLFVAGSYVGNGQVVIEMNEIGELEELVQEYKVCGVCESLINIGIMPLNRVTGVLGVSYVAGKGLYPACGVKEARKASRTLSMTSNVQYATKMDYKCVQNAFQNKSHKSGILIILHHKLVQFNPKMYHN